MVEVKMNGFGTPIELTPSRLVIWQRTSKERGEIFSCEFCGHVFKSFNTFFIMYTNEKGQRPGNPVLCVDCHAIPFGERLEIWKSLGDKKLLFNLIRRCINEEI